MPFTISLQPRSATDRDPGHRPSQEGARGSWQWGKSRPRLPMLPTDACGPGGRGAEGRGDIIRAAPPPASTSSQARRSIHDIIGLISTPLFPGPQQRDAPPPQLQVRPNEPRGAAGTATGRSREGRCGGPASLTRCLGVRRGVFGADATGPARWRSPKPARRGARRGPGSAPRPSRSPPGPRPPVAAANAGPPSSHAPRGRQ